MNKFIQLQDSDMTILNIENVTMIRKPQFCNDTSHLLEVFIGYQNIPFQYFWSSEDDKENAYQAIKIDYERLRKAVLEG